MTAINLLKVYLPLIGWTAVGYILGRLLPRATPTHIGKFLFWVGVPVAIIAFLRHSQLSTALWLAPVTAWIAVLGGAALAWCLTRWQQDNLSWNRRTKGSFLLAAMVGNTGYIGFPVSLALVGPQYFAWALFYDLLGSTPAAYGLGVALAARASEVKSQDRWLALKAIAQNPALWSFGIGLIYRDLPLPPFVESSLKGFAWFVVSLSLVLVGMRLSQLSSLRHVKPAVIGVGIKMLIVPLAIGAVLWAVGINGMVHRAIVLQMAMPPAFATLVIAEAYELDPELAVTALAIGSICLIFTLPLWVWLFGH